MNPIISQFNLSPIMIEPRQIGALHGLKPEFNTSEMSVQELALVTGMSADGVIKPFQEVDGIAIINVNGGLIHNLGWSSRNYTGYDVIKRKVAFAMRDKDVKGVLMRFHTPGGSAHGCADTGDMIHELGKLKPVWTISEDMAYSAGQWLHSQGTRRLVTQSGGMGSVGVVIAHVDVSKALEEWGYKMTLIHDGEHKVDGNPYEALPSKVKAKLQDGCKQTRRQFAAAVARGTGMSLDDVLSTEAECYTGQEAVDIGFADAVVSSNTILSEFIEHVNKPSQVTTIGKVMDPKKNTQQANTQTSDKQLSDVTITELTSEQSQQAERARIKGITSCEHAEGRSELANHLAFETSMSVEQASAILATAQKASVTQAQAASTGSDAFSQAMKSEDHPQLSADGSDEQSDIDSPQAQAAAIFGDYKAATGAK